MRQSPKQNRMRQKNGRKPNGPSPNRVYESTGPEGKVRGTPQQIIEKYQSLARDKSTSGDRVMAESFLQHAEHYMRILTAAQPQTAPQRRDERDGDAEIDAVDADAGEAREDAPRGGDRVADSMAVVDHGDEGRAADAEALDLAPAEASGDGDPDAQRRRPRRTARRPRSEGEGDAPAAGTTADGEPPAPRPRRRVARPRKPAETPALPLEGGGDDAEAAGAAEDRLRA